VTSNLLILAASNVLFPWSGFQQIHLRSDARITRAACAAHARRKVHECRSSHPQQASVLLAMFRQLYDIEDRGKDLVHPGLLWVQAQTAAVEEDGRFEILAVSEAAWTAFD
jgi:hypothetical protein